MSAVSVHYGKYNKKTIRISDAHVLIRGCGSMLYVGLTGIVLTLIQKSMGWFGVKHFFSS